VEEYDQKLEIQKKRIERVLEGIEDHSIKVKKRKKQELSLLEQLEDIENQILIEEKKLIHFTQKVEIQNQLTQRKQQQMEEIQRQKDSLQKHTENRLAAYYRTGDIGLINVMFSAASLPELISFRESYHLMLKFDQQTIRSYRDKIEELRESKAAHEIEKQKLSKAITQVEEQRLILAASKAERKKLLQRVVTEKKLYQQALEEMEKAAENLNNTLASLEEKREEVVEKKEQQFIKDFPLKAFKKRRPLHLRGFAGKKGQLPAPSAGTVIKYFGENSPGRFGIRTISTGIDIKTNPGSDIKAIYPGKILYAGPLRGYGKLVIIDHGNDYFTLTGGVGNITKKANEYVETGERIATSSLHTGQLDEGFHFEIRFNTKPLDPLNWLDLSSDELQTNLQE
jgi:septal ring factor EnvC (AmiA/AmiB activator)